MEETWGKYKKVKLKQCSGEISVSFSKWIWS